MKSWLPNAVCFQLVWVACVGGAAKGWWWAGPAAVAIFAAWQLPLSRWPRADMLLMLRRGVGLPSTALDTTRSDALARPAMEWFARSDRRTVDASPDSIIPSRRGKAHLWIAALLGVIAAAATRCRAAWSAVDWSDLNGSRVALALAWGIRADADEVANRLSPRRVPDVGEARLGHRVRFAVGR